jgi:hypothetical protein
MQDYLKGVKDFINFILSNSKNISECEIRFSCVKCKNKKFHYKNVMMMYLFKIRFVEKYLYWFVYEEPYIPNKSMLQMMIGSTSNSSYTYEVVDDNNNSYRSLVMDARRINQDYLGEGSHSIHLDEEQNVDATRFLELLKGCDEPL